MFYFGETKGLVLHQFYFLFQMDFIMRNAHLF